MPIRDDLLPPPNDDQLAQYLGGVASSDDADYVEVWAADPANAERLAMLRRAWQMGAEPESAGNANAFVEGWRARVAAESSGERAQNRRPGKQSLRVEMLQRPRRIHSAFVGLTGSITLLLLAIHTVQTFQQRNSLRTYRTVARQQGRVALADGSSVILAPLSRLTISRQFGKQNRQVELEGEGYFTATPNATSPFVVHTKAVAIRVLGTQFTVSHYAPDHSVRVAVVTGKVLAAGARDSLTISQGRVAEFTDSTARIIPDQAADVSAWTQGTLMFRDTPVLTVLATLGRWYGYDFQLADSTLTHERVTMEVHARALGETMLMLKAMLRVTMVFHGTRVTLYPASRRDPPVRNNSDRSFLPSMEIGR